VTTALVLSGGGSFGAVQVGMLHALADHGIVPDLLTGTSVGAVNGAYLAGRPGRDGLDRLTRIWRSIRRSDIFPFDPALSVRALVGRSNHVVRNHKFRRLLQAYIHYQNLEDAKLPLLVVATDVTSGKEAVLSRGSVIEAVLASIAVPGIFPPVRIGGKLLMDGAVANNSPISVAVEHGATTIYVLHAGYACALQTPPRSALGMAMHALTVILQRRLLTDIAAYRASVHLRVVPPVCPMEISPADFSQNS
jgi:NTE family protein